MQLDVTWLFDDFTGSKPGGETYRSTYYNNIAATTATARTSGGDTDKDVADSSSSTKVTWEDLKRTKVPLSKVAIDRMVECSNNEG